jgi:hypothetical protein
VSITHPDDVVYDTFCAKLRDRVAVKTGVIAAYEPAPILSPAFCRAVSVAMTNITGLAILASGGAFLLGAFR